MKFRRRKSGEATPRPSVPVPGTEEPERAELPHPKGPWDISDVDDPEGSGLVDLGGLLIRGREGVELRVQVDERTQQLVSVLLAGEEGAVELRPFAAPRNESIWDEVREDIIADAEGRGGTAQEQDGEFGVELACTVPVKTPDGKQGTQVSRLVGVSGPRWLLRGTFLGKPATDPQPDGPIESAFRDVVVRRGDTPMAPRASIPLHMPEGAGPADPSDASGPQPPQ